MTTSTKTTTTYAAQKSIAQILDRAAARAEMVGARPASGKQCWFLAKLIVDAGEGEFGADEFILNTNSILTSNKASGRIQSYLNEKAA